MDHDLKNPIDVNEPIDHLLNKDEFRVARDVIKVISSSAKRGGASTPTTIYNDTATS